MREGYKEGEERAGRCEQRREVRSIARGLLNSPSVSLKLYASASFVFSEFAFLMRVCVIHVYVCVYMYSQNEKSPSRFSSAGHVYDGQEQQKTKRPFPVTDRPDTTEIGCSYLVE